MSELTLKNASAPTIAFPKMLTLLVLALVVSFIAFFAPGAAAQVPTAVPAEVQTNLDNAGTLVIAIGTAIVVVIAAIAAIRYARGVFG